MDQPVVTQVWRVDPERPEPEILARAAALLRRGGLVAFPTETVYGLGANAWDAAAVRRIFAAKERPAYDPLIVHLASPEALPQVAQGIPPRAWALVERFWPGPLTLVLPRAAGIPDAVTAGGDTVAVRCPAHPVALALLRAAAIPVAAPSANRFGHTSPTTAQHVWEDLAGRIELILDAGPTPVGVESTVLDVTRDPPVLLRPGGVTKEALEAFLGVPIEGPGRRIEPGRASPSPGMLPRHYAPNTPLWLFLGPRAWALAAMRRVAQQRLERGERVGLLLTAEDQGLWRGLPVTVQILGQEGDWERIAQGLYGALRRLDKADLSIILARDLGGGAALGLAIRDRLRRAASRVITPEGTPRQQ